MNLFNLSTIQYYMIIGAASFALGVAGSGIGIAKYKDNFYNAKIMEIENDYLAKLAKETVRVSETEHELESIKNQLELKGIEENEKIKSLLAKYNAAVTSGKRLRDPGKQTSSCPSTGDSKSPNINRGSDTGGELSLEANRFLLAEAARADRILQELKLCKEWANKTREEVKQFNKEKNVFLSD